MSKPGHNEPTSGLPDHDDDYNKLQGLIEFLGEITGRKPDDIFEDFMQYGYYCWSDVEAKVNEYTKRIFG